MAAMPTPRTNSLYPSQAGLGYNVGVPGAGGTVTRDPDGEQRRVPDNPDTGTDLFSRIRDWRSARQREAPYTERDLWNRAYTRVHGQLPSQITGQWNKFFQSRYAELAGEQAGVSRIGTSRTPATPIWDQAASGSDLYRQIAREFEQKYLPHPERIADPDAPNIAGLLTELGSAIAYDRELFANQYRTNVNRIAGERRAAMGADRYLHDQEATARELRDALQGLEGKLAEDLDITRDAGYRHELAEALRAQDARFAAAGMTQSGARGRALTQLASRLAASRTAEMSARRRADIGARAGLLRDADANLMAALGRRSGVYQKGVDEDFQQRQESEATLLDNRLAALRQKGGAAGEALQLMHEDYLDEMDRRERDDLEALNVALAGKGLAAQERASRRASRDKRFGALLQLGGDLAQAFSSLKAGG